MNKKRLLSAAICFHLLVIVLYPNDSSHLERDLLPVLLPYANTFGLNSKWQFFAPEPEIATYFEYQIDWKDKPNDINGDEMLHWPPDKRGFFDLGYTRRNAARSFLTLDPNFLSQIFINWICRTNPEAAGVSVRAVYVKVPSLKDVRAGQALFDPSNLQYQDAVVYSCEEALRET
ncbi:MAG: hypothetical protein ABL958_06700 [Bdellovibrionia bacterium]